MLHRIIFYKAKETFKKSCRKKIGKNAFTKSSAELFIALLHVKAYSKKYRFKRNKKNVFFILSRFGYKKFM